MVAGRQSVTIRLLGDFLVRGRAGRGPGLWHPQKKVTNDNSSSTVWQQASAIGSQKLWELVIPLSAAFTEAVHNEANIFQVCMMTGGRSV